MKRLLVTLMIAVAVTNMAHAESCKTAATTMVRENIYGKVLGRLPSATTVTVKKYDMDRKGRQWAQVSWQGQAIKAKGAKPNTVYTSGWIARSALSCH